jgi:hypothetical protein
MVKKNWPILNFFVPLSLKTTRNNMTNNEKVQNSKRSQKNSNLLCAFNAAPDPQTTFS